jgi:hypothetical protein
MLHENIPCSREKQSQSTGEDAYSRIYGAEASQYYRRVFDLFVSKFSESGPVVTNLKHSWIGFTVPLWDAPELTIGTLWESRWTLENHIYQPKKRMDDSFGPDTEILGWFCLYNYAHRAWRISNHGMQGNLPALPANVTIRRRWISNLSISGESKIELSFHESEIPEIDFKGLRKLVLDVFFGASVSWPIAPWTEDNWHYSWTGKGWEYMMVRERREKGGSDGEGQK